MKPGYRKNTKYIISNRSETGFINKNQAVDLIKKYADSSQFYEVEPAEVLKVHLETDQKSFPKTKLNGKNVPDLKFFGAVTVRLLHSQSGRDYLDELVRPISPHIVQYPLKGEIVNVAEYDGNLYYYNPLNTDSKVNMNRILGRDGEGKVFPALTKYNRPIKVKQGDTIFQGRFGQSIQFSSDINFARPNLKITVGQSQNLSTVGSKSRNEYESHPSDINLDDASIYITTNEHIPLKSAAKSKMKPPRLGENQSSAMVFNSDTLAINAKESDAHIYARRNINLASETSINLETEFGEIKLGDVDTNNPAVKGKELNDFLTEFVSLIENYADAMKVAEKPEDKTVATTDLIASLGGLKDSLGPNASFYSKKVFISNDHNPPIIEADGSDNSISNTGNESDLDAESMWDNVEWDEVENVEDVYYEVEKITPVAGVRG
tara:strand:+ start:1978 stop:3282 length:1305 start_codon:yes stop_codon:yes gene_type:complete